MGTTPEPAVARALSRVDEAGPVDAATWDAAGTALDALGIGVWRLDAELRFRSANRTGRQTLGVAWADVEGRSVLEIFPHFTGDAEHQALLTAAAAGGPGGAVCRWGSVRRRWLETSIRPVLGGGAVVASHDLPGDVVLAGRAVGGADSAAVGTAGVLRLGETLNALTDPVAVANVATDELPVLFGATAAHLVLGRHTRVRVPQAQRDLDAQVLDAAEQSRTGGRLVAADAADGTRLVAVPVVVAGEHVCSLVLVFDAAAALDSTGLRLLHMAIALWGQAFVRADTHAQDVERALTLQRSLLPTALPTHPAADIAASHRAGSTALSVGGDFYDAVLAADGSLVVVLGDVQGHDLSSVTLMGQMRAALRSSMLLGLSPTRVLANAERYLAEMDTELLVPACVVQVHPGSRWATIATAGHLGPWTASHGMLDELPVGPPLGVGFGGGWRETTLPLAATDVLVLVSDGLVESRSLDISTGLEHLSAALEALTSTGAGARDVVDALLRTEPLGNGADDVTALVVRTTPESAGPADPLPPVRRRMLADAETVPLARQFLRDVAAACLGAAGAAPDVTAAALSDVEQIGVELLSNAVRHSSTTVDVGLAAVRDDGGLQLRIEVSDDNPRLPRLPEPLLDLPADAADADLDARLDAEVETGRGLRLVVALAARWGCAPTASGKVVWAELDVDAG